MDFSTIFTYLIDHLDFVISLVISCGFLVVNIIQAIRTHDKNKLKEAICRIPEIIRSVEALSANFVVTGENNSTTTAIFKSAYKKATVESILRSEFGVKFFNKYKQTFDDAIEDILNTPQKKGGSVDVS